MEPTKTGYGTTAADAKAGSSSESLRDTARGMAEDARNEASRLAGQAREGVRAGIASAQDEAQRRANRGFERAADEVSRTSQALESAAGEFEEGSIQRQLLSHAADGLTRVSDTLRGKSIGDVASDLAEFGRRNPAAFIGGAALIGFAIARFARASRSGESHFEEGRYGAYAGRGEPYRPVGQPQHPPASHATTHTPYGTAGGQETTGAYGTTGGASTTAGPAGGTTPSGSVGARSSTGVTEKGERNV